MTSREELVHQVAGHLHANQPIDAARLVAEFTFRDKPGKLPLIDDPSLALEFNNSLFYWCLNNDRYEWAAELIWGRTLFDPTPRCTRLVWEEIKASNSLMLMGAASMSKSYGAGAWLLLDWVRDPEYTSVNIAGPSEDHLKDNLFTHLVTMHSQSMLPLPGEIGELFIGLDLRKRKGAIRGIVIPVGKRPSGRLQGRKRVPRKIPHPTLGKLSRMRIFLDEVEKIPQGIWKDVDNVFANLDSDIDGFKIMTAFNPEDISGKVAERCEPPKGWKDFDREKDERWTSKRGWRVLRLDAAKCENVVQKKVVYPGLQTYEGFNRIILNAGGPDAPGALTMARACFPLEGAIYTVISPTLVQRMRGEFLFAEEPTNYGSADLALEGGDDAEFCLGRFGRAIGIRKYPNMHDRRTFTEIFFKDKLGQPRMRWALQVDQLFQLERGDTVAMAEQLKRNSITFKIAPGCLMLDRTGNGAGVHDLMKSLWSPEVMGVNYTEAATEMKILEEDTKTAKEEYERAVSELWFGLKKWSEFDFVKLKDEVLSEDLTRDLIGRRYATGKLTRVETKPDYKARGNPSPNKADALTLLVLGVRRHSRVIPSALDDMAGDMVGLNVAGDTGPIPVICDETNRFRHFDDPETPDYMD